MGRLVTTREGAVEVDAGFVRRWIDEVAASVERERDHLTHLDAAIGDADHGVNLERGFKAVRAKLDGTADPTPGQVLVTVGTTLISTVGGASGPLYGTAFRSAGKALGDVETVAPGELASALRAALGGVEKLGAASPGDKTMVDAFEPAVATFERELAAGASLDAACHAASDAALEGARATIPMQARKGRASYLGPRSVGHQDPGATSTALVFSALERVASAGT
jgi:phosphoenolpyruvate---glycerone phosphotransferase subunit DhaL